jgi:Tfp pilus assembly protein PilF
MNSDNEGIVPSRMLSIGRRLANPLWAGGILVLVTLLAYIPAIRGGFIWDDDEYVSENPVLNRPGGFRALWLIPSATPQYYPLVFTSFWLEYRLWGLAPAGYHVTNVLLHALAALLLWRMLRGLGLKGAYLAGLIFALHPVHVESVAWVTERKNVLSGVFYMAAAWSYLRCRPLGMDQGGSRYRWTYYALSFFLFACALLTKTVTASLPGGLALLIWWKRRRFGRAERSDLLKLLPFFVLGITMGLMTAWLEKHQVGAKGEEWSLTVVERFLVAGRALWFYAGKLVWPVQLAFVYPRWEVSQAVWWQYLYPLLAVLVVVALWLARNRIGRGWLAGVLYFSGTLLPALGFLNVYPHRFSYVADHFQYLASLGLLIPASSLLWGLLVRMRCWGRWVPGACVLLVATLLGSATWGQGRVYKDLETLWTDTLSKNPDSFLAHNNLGNLLRESGRPDEAAHHYGEALRIRPDCAEAWNNLGVVMSRPGSLDKAVEYYTRAIALNADYVDAVFNMGTVLLTLGRPEEAEGYYRRALRLAPSFAQARNSLGVALMRQGKLGEAEAEFQEALRLEPNHQDARENLRTLRHSPP